MGSWSGASGMTSGGWDGQGNVGYNNQESAQWQTDADAYNVSVSSNSADRGAVRPETQQPAAYGTQPGMRPVSAGAGQAVQDVQRPQDPRHDVPRQAAPGYGTARRSVPGHNVQANSFRGPNVPGRNDPRYTAQRHNVQTRARPLPVHRAKPMTAQVLGPTWW
jgi:hypothetical protein